MPRPHHPSPPFRLLPAAAAVAVCAALLVAALAWRSAAEQEPSRLYPEDPNFPVSAVIGEERQLLRHLDQAEIDAGRVPMKELIRHGKLLFETVFTSADGLGRPGLDGHLPPRPRPTAAGLHRFDRVSGPEADSCAGCHNRPFVGGGGDSVTSIFSQAHSLALFDQPGGPARSPSSVGNVRATTGMFGSGPIEMLAREMTADLQAIRERARQQARSGGREVTVELVAKGVRFGSVTARPDGTVDTARVEGVDPDLVIRPFDQKGTVVSLREFTNNAFLQHHGLLSVERFGKDTDPDGDGVTNELTVGDITAVTVFQASLWPPGRVLPRVKAVTAAIKRGDDLFGRIGCAGCHIPELKLESRTFVEPNPFNPAGNLQPKDVPRPFRFDMTEEGERPRLEKAEGGGAWVRAFTDLKRHDLGDHPLMANERVPVRGLPPATFLTRRLWGSPSEPPYLHNGRATTLTEAILAHGGEARTSRDAFASLPEQDRRCVIEFLKSMRIMPPGTKFLSTDEHGFPRNRRP